MVTEDDSHQIIKSVVCIHNTRLRIDLSSAVCMPHGPRALPQLFVYVPQAMYADKRNHNGWLAEAAMLCRDPALQQK